MASHRLTQFASHVARGKPATQAARLAGYSESTARTKQHAKDRLHWKGSQIAYLAFDQLEEFEESQFWYLTSRNRSTCGVRPYIRATVNPDPDSWVKGFLAPWVDDRHPEYPFPPGAARHFTRDGDSLVWVDADYRWGSTSAWITRPLGRLLPAVCRAAKGARRPKHRRAPLGLQRRANNALA